MAKFSKMAKWLFILMILLSTTKAFATEHQFQTGLALNTISVYVTDEDSFTLNETGFEMCYSAVGDKATFNANFSYCPITSDLQSIFYDASCLWVFDFSVSFGPTFINTKNVYLSFIGKIGFQSIEISGNHYDISAIPIYVGPALNFSCSFSRKIGVYASFGVFHSFVNARINYPSSSYDTILQGGIVKFSLGLKFSLSERKKMFGL